MALSKIVEAFPKYCRLLSYFIVSQPGNNTELPQSLLGSDHSQAAPSKVGGTVPLYNIFSHLGKNSFR